MIRSFLSKSFRAVAAFVLIVNLLSLPPVARLARSVAPLGAVLHLQDTMSGTISARMLTVAVEQHFLERFESAPNRGREWSVVFSGCSEAGIVSCVFNLVELGIDFPLRILVGAQWRCANLDDVLSANEDKAIAVELMDGLTALGILQTCFSGTSTRFYRNTLATALLCTSSTAAGHSRAGMATLLNHPQLSAAMAEVFPDRVRGKSVSVASLGDHLWRDYAKFSFHFSQGTAKDVADIVSREMVNGRFTLIDYGAGSGVFTSQLLELRPDTQVVMVDLAHPLALLRETFRDARFVEAFEGDQDWQAVDILASKLDPNLDNDTVVMFNSFLQHFDDEGCVALLRKVATAFRSAQIRRATFVVTELAIPGGSFDPSVEWLQSARSFAVALRSFTVNGRMRSVKEYSGLLSTVFDGLQGWACSEAKLRHLTPMPAVILSLSCEASARN